MRVIKTRFGLLTKKFGYTSELAITAEITDEKKKSRGRGERKKGEKKERENKIRDEMCNFMRRRVNLIIPTG